MAFDGTDSCWIPDVPFTFDEEPRLRVAQFGDGYQQRALDGINWLNRKWVLTWTMREAGVVGAMIQYFRAQKGGAFPFLDPVGKTTTFQVFCDRWSVDWELNRRRNGTDNYYGTLSAEFVQANGVTA